jgi:acyl-CoA synthetase (AMP-forming)/AMP-acid ligase II
MTTPDGVCLRQNLLNEAMTKDAAGGASLPTPPALLAGGAGNVWDALEVQVLRQPGSIAVQMGDRSFSYAEFGSRVRAMAETLQAQGVAAGDRVAVLSENRPEYLEVLFACARLGAIAACQNWRLSAGELNHCLQLVSPKVICVSTRFEVMAGTLCTGDAARLRWPVDAQGLVMPASTPSHAEMPGGEAGLYILYTSGTTGFPKAALISHRAILARMASHIIDRPTSPQAAFVAWSPLFHMGATDFSLATLMRGGKVIVMDGFDADALAQLVVREEIGHLTIVPGVVERFLSAFASLNQPARKVQVVGVMADLVPAAQIAELTRLLGAPYCNTFGATETGAPPASRGLIPVGVAPHRLPKVQSSGCVIRLVDDEGNDVPAGEPGELLLRSATLFSGYWGDQAATEEAFRDGWYHMGDVFRRNTDGTLDFVDRKKYLIKSGGENIYPAEVEQALKRIPGIEEAVVVRQSDPRWGEVPVAVLVVSDPSLSPANILQSCRASIASYKLPRRLVFASGAALPRNVSGKVERLRLERFLSECPSDLSHLPENAFK